jgi:hypothetical protein
MTLSAETTPTSERELVITRMIDAGMGTCADQLAALVAKL